MFHLPISVMAVKQEESNIEKCYLKNAFNSRIDILSRYNEFNMHTIVCHNVGCHLDIFGSRTASFENKAIFKVKSKSINHKNIGQDYSRGGGNTNGEFCYALLDWGIKQTRRRACINHGIITDEEQFSKRTLYDFFTIHPNTHDVAQDCYWNLNTMDYNGNS